MAAPTTAALGKYLITGGAAAGVFHAIKDHFQPEGGNLIWTWTHHDLSPQNVNNVRNCAFLITDSVVLAIPRNHNFPWRWYPSYKNMPDLKKHHNIMAQVGLGKLKV